MKLRYLKPCDKFIARFYASVDDTEPCMTITGIFEGMYTQSLCNVVINGNAAFEDADLEVEKIEGGE